MKPITQSNSSDIEANIAKEHALLQEKLWIDSTLTQFDDVLRENYDKSLEDFSEAIINHLAVITKAVKGAFFNLKEDKEQLLVATGGFACAPDTMPKNSFRFGEDLIGQTAKIQKITYIDNLPLQNLTLNVAAGNLSAGSLVILPLVFNDKTYGVIELVFIQNLSNKYLDLLPRLGSNIASMLQSIQNSIQTKKLLNSTQQQTEALKAQEEELRQNLEELATTQEAMEKKQEEIEKMNFTLANKEQVLEEALQEAKIKEKELLDLQSNLTVEAERARVLFDTARDAIVVMDQEGFFTDVNEAAVQIFGGSKREDLIGKTPMDFSPPTQSLYDGRTSEEVARGIMETTMKTGTYNHEWHFKKLNGEIFDAEIKLVSFELQNKPYMQFVVRDITEKKKQERALVSANKELRQNLDELKKAKDHLLTLKDELAAEAERSRVLFDTARDAIVVMDQEGFFTDVNEAAVQIFGGSKKEDLLGQTPMDFSPPTQSLYDGRTSEEVARGIMEATMQTGTYNHEWHFKKLNGEIFDAEIKLVSFELQNKPYMQFVVRDITEKKAQEYKVLQANKALKSQAQETQQNLEALKITQNNLVKLKDELAAEVERSHILFETSRDAIVVMDKNGVFTDANEAAVQIFGCSEKEQLLGKTPMDYSPPTQSLYDGRTSEEVARGIMEATLQTGTYTHEWHFKKRDGKRFDAEVKLVSFELQNQPYMQFVVRDISAFKQQIRTLEEQLGDNVSDRNENPSI